MPSRAVDRTIVAVDAAAERITVNEGDQLKTYRFAMRADVVLNGQRAALSELAPKMKVVAFTLSDPQTIRKIEVSGMGRPIDAAPKAAAAEPPQKPSVASGELKSLTEKLVGTYWTWPSERQPDSNRSWFRLNADGTATAGWHPMSGSWKVLSKDTLQLQIAGGEIKRGWQNVIRIDPHLMKLGQTFERIMEPTEGMKNKVSAPPATQ